LAGDGQVAELGGAADAAGDGPADDAGFAAAEDPCVVGAASEGDVGFATTGDAKRWEGAGGAGAHIDTV